MDICGGVVWGGEREGGGGRGVGVERRKKIRGGRVWCGFRSICEWGDLGGKE